MRVLVHFYSVRMTISDINFMSAECTYIVNDWLIYNYNFKTIEWINTNSSMTYLCSLTPISDPAFFQVYEWLSTFCNNEWPSTV